MASPKHSASNLRTRGFTLTEVLIVIGLLAIIGGFTAVANYDNYRMGALRDERRTLVTALQKARAEALNNLNQAPHGVKVLPGGTPSYVVFEGGDYASADHDKDVPIPSAYPVVLAGGSLDEVAFTQLSGEALCAGGTCGAGQTITLHDPVRNTDATVTINAEGRIDW